MTGSTPLTKIIMRELDPRIHVFAKEEDVDGRIKSGHDGDGRVYL